MAWLIAPRDLTSLFPAGPYFNDGPMDAGFLLLRAGKLCGYLSIFRIFWSQKTPRTLIGWIAWTVIFLAISACSCILGNPGKVTILNVLAGMIPLILPLIECLELTVERYRWAIKFCLEVVRVSEHSAREIARTYAVENLEQFKVAYNSILIEEAKEISMQTASDFKGNRGL